MDLHRFELVDVLEQGKKKVSLCVYLCFNRRFEPESSRTLDFDSVFVDFWLESENKSVISSFHLHRFKSFEFSFLLLLNLSSAIVFEFAASSGEFALEL